MILQCDQCNTRFRLDESKLKPGGVKVRCSKCRHVFTVEAEQKLEESEFDSILSGLGASSAVGIGEAPASDRFAGATGSPGMAAAGTNPPSPPTAPAEFPDFGSFDLAAEPGAMLETPLAAADDAFDFGEIDFAPAAGPESAAPEASAPEAAAPEAAYGEFSFADEPAQTEVQAPAPAADTFDFGEFSFATEPAQPLAESAVAGPSGLDFGDFDFGDQAVTPPVESAAAAANSPVFGELSLPEEPEVESELPAAPPANFESDFGDIDFNEQPAPEVQAPSGGKDSFDFGEFSFGEVPAATTGQPAAADAGALDFGDFSFGDEPAAPAGPAAAPAGGASDYGDFSFGDEPAPPPGQGAAAGVGASDFGDFSFGAEPDVPVGQGAAAGVGASDFGDFSFGAEPAAPAGQAGVAGGGASDFGDFSFGEEPAAAVGQPAAPPVAPAAALGGAADFGDFSFGEEPAAKSEQSLAAGKDEFDFSGFSFAEEPAGTKGAPPAAGADAFDFGEFSFGEEAAAEDQPPPLPAAGDDFGDFSFAGEAPLAKTAATGGTDADFGDLSFADDLQHKPADVAAPVSDDIFSLGEFSFSGNFSEPEAPDPSTLARKPEPPAKPAPAAAAEAFSTGGPVHYQSPATVSPAAETGKQASETSLDFNFGDQLVPDPYADEEEELPPLSISSRRKGRSLFTISIVAVCVLVILALSGAGLYLLQSGPEALKQFDQLGIGFVAKWFGMESPEEGRITIRNPLAAFHQNKEAGEIFVVNGQVVNSYRKARASIHVRVSLFDKNGAVLLQKTAYCGNRLSNEQLATLPMAKIESIMNNQFGDSLANLGVKPGNAIGFVVAVANVPKEAVDFGVEVVGSTVAGQ